MADQLYFLCRLMPPRPDFMITMTPEERSIMQAHVGYWTGKVTTGNALVFGPVGGPGGGYGIGIIRVADMAEMEALHSAYEKYHARNFEIISISFDARPEDVLRYRRGRWTMPWRHAVVEGGLQSAISERFEVGGIPKPILVDAKGRIVAVDEELRGEYLGRTLERVLGGMN